MYANKSKSKNQQQQQETREKQSQWKLKEEKKQKKQSRSKEEEKRKKQLTRSRNCFDRVNICEMSVDTIQTILEHTHTQRHKRTPVIWFFDRDSHSIGIYLFFISGTVFIRTVAHCTYQITLK